MDKMENLPKMESLPKHPIKEWDAFMHDFELECLAGWHKSIPKGPKRHEDPEWQKHVATKVAPYHSLVKSPKTTNGRGLCRTLTIDFWDQSRREGRAQAPH